MKYLAIIALPFLLAGCDDEVSVLKGATIGEGVNFTNGEVFGDRPVCEKTEWKAFEVEGVKKVGYSCLLKSSEKYPNYSDKIEKDAIAEADKAAAASEEKAAINHKNKIDELEKIIAEVKTYVNGLTEATSKEERDKIYWYTTARSPVDAFDQYAKTPEGKEAVEKLYSLTNKGGDSRHALFYMVEALGSEDKEIVTYAKEMFMKGSEAFIATYKHEIEKENNSYSLRAHEKLIDEFRDAALYKVRSEYPVSRTEKVIWTWSKLDKKYTIEKHFSDFEMMEGVHNEYPLCLDFIAYAVNKGINNIDTYLDGIKENEKYCTPYKFLNQE